MNIIKEKLAERKELKKMTPEEKEAYKLQKKELMDLKL